MDFINGCTTNVHVLDNFTTTPFIHYKHIAPQSSIGRKIKDAQQTIVELRESKVLCTLVDLDIWLFGRVEYDLGNEYVVVKKGVVQGQKESARLLLDAIEAALTYTLAQAEQLTHIAPWTWLYCDHAADDDAETSIVILRVNESLSGALYILSETTSSAWMPVAQTFNHDNDEVLLAPYGNSATLTAMGPTGVTGDAQWRTQVGDVLHLEGIYIDEDTEWTDVEVIEDGVKTIFSWPSQLCLSRRPSQTPDCHGLVDTAEWQMWNDNGHGRTYRDPLAEAEDWFMGSAERKLRAADGPSKAEAQIIPPSGAATANDLNMATSPPFLQRTADQQAAMSGIYPTPPDGLAHQGQTQLGPQTGMSAATPSVTQPGDSASATEVLKDTHEVGDDSLEFDDYPMDEAGEDLFGDVGGTMFEENEVGDEDFDYFDEPDNAPGAESMTQEKITGDPTLDSEVDAPIEEPSDGSTMGNVDASRKPASVAEHASSPPPAEDVPTNTLLAVQVRENEERALSPFGIRERLLPPPVPASIAPVNEGTKHFRRSSSFAPIIFRDGVDLGAKYADMYINTSLDASNPSGPNIALPSSRAHGESDDSSDESQMSELEDAVVEMPPRLPWESTKKRKRSRDIADAISVDLGEAWSEENADVYGDGNDTDQQQNLRKTLLDRILRSKSTMDIAKLAKQATYNQSQLKEEVRELPSLQELFDLKKEDLIYIAQLVAEQASTCLVHSLSCKSPETRNTFPGILLTKALTDLVPSSLEPCDLSQLAMIREPALPLRLNARTPIPPRPGPEAPDIFPLPAPYTRIQRNNESWEMLPTALSFWEPNGLAAASGPKYIKAKAVFPSNNDLRAAVRSFMGALGRTYEGCKLGAHSYEMYDDDDEDAEVMAGEKGEGGSKLALLRGYASACVEVGKELATLCAESGTRTDSQATFVVYLLDPFTAAGWPAGKDYLCACFWMLFQSYLERLKSGGRGRGDDQVPDVVLQILPVELVASMDRLIIPDPVTLSNLAREVYDRCPSSAVNDADEDGLASPSILLAPPVPKRIAFQLLADVPAESLLQDGRVLHLAIAMSGDREWMSCVWSDGQGRILSHESFCMRGLTVTSVVRQAWQRTGELTSRLRVIWRVFVVLDEGVWRGAGLDRVWRDVVTSGRVGGTTVCVTLAKVHTEIGVRVIGDTMTGDGANGLATPASTPAAVSNGNGAATGTNSPNIGASDGFGAPLTPAGSESTISGAAAAMQVVENDPDAHLVEVEDESCALLFKPQLSALAGMDGMANGAIVRKGKDEASGRGLLGVSLCWTLQVKPQGAGAVEMGSLRQAEVTLREVLRMYRALGVLTRARGLHEGEGGVLPVHLAVACKGAKGLEGFLS